MTDSTLQQQDLATKGRSFMAGQLSDDDEDDTDDDADENEQLQNGFSHPSGYSLRARTGPQIRATSSLFDRDQYSVKGMYNMSVNGFLCSVDLARWRIVG